MTELLLTLDPRTIFSLYFWANLFISTLIVTYYFSYGTSDNKDALKKFALSKFLLSAGLIFLLLRGHIPNVLSINLANTIVFTSSYFESLVIISMLRVVPRMLVKFQLALLIVLIVVFNVFVEIGANYNLRTLVFTCSTVAIYFIPIVLFISEKKKNPFRTIYAVSFATFLIIFALRGIHVYNDPSSRLFSGGLFEIVYALATFLLSLVGVVGFLLLAKEKQDRRIDQLLKDKDRFFSIIAHDLRGPLGSSVGISEILAEGANEMTPAEIQNIATLILESNKNCFKLLENLLSWSQVQTGLICFNPQQINLHQLIADNLSLNKNLAQNKEISLHFENKADIVLTADKNMIDTVLRNLLTNAIKFTPRSGRVRIECHRKNDLAEISITDTGVGMDEKTKNKLFKMSERVSSNGTENEAGTGLGLLLCKEFIDKHNGEIWAESALGTGSSFRFTLPLN